MKSILEVWALVIVGSVAGAELGSWYCVQPVVSRLEYACYVAMEQGMLRTFGRVMPFLMPLSGALALALLVLSRDDSNPVLWLRIATALYIAAAVATTLIVNVPINDRTSKWLLAADQKEWEQMRARWYLLQGVRVALLVVAFVLLAISVVVGHS